MLVNCVECNKCFEKPAAWVRRNPTNFCSRPCHDVYQRSHRLTKKCKVCNSDFSVAPSMQRRFSTCSKVCQQVNRGKENNPTWKGGVTNTRLSDMSTKRYKEWRKAVFKRDKYTCQACGHKGGDLHCDHILPYAFFPDLRYEISNGRALCAPCHRKTYKEAAKYRDGNTPILVKDINNGQVSRYYSLLECARSFNATKSGIETHLKQSSKGKLFDGRYLFIYEGRNWPSFLVSNSANDGFSKSIIATNVEGTKIVIFESYIGAAKYFDYKRSKLAMHILRFGDKPYDGWIFRYTDENAVQE